MNLKDSALAAATSYRETQLARGWSSVPTPRRFLLEALGCHQKAEPIAYFEYEDLYGLLEQARDAIEDAAGNGLEQISLQPDTWLEELAQVFEPLPAIPTPASPTLRPGCNPVLRAGTCRMPAVGVVAVAHFALVDQPNKTLAETLDHLEITTASQSLAILESVDPTIRNAPVPEGLSDLRDKLVPPIPTNTDDSIKITARLLHQLADQYTGVAVEDLLQAS